MKRRIEQLLNGIFEYKQGTLRLLPEELELKAEPGAAVHGRFLIVGGEDQKVHGFLYPSDPRMVCEPSEFQGITNEIQYQFDASGLEAGAASEGWITVCSDCGEYRVPYAVAVAPARAEEALPFTDLSGFAQLARQDYQKAYRSFLLPGFRALLQGQPLLSALYDSLKQPDVSYRSMEAFLVGAGLKEALELSVDNAVLELGELSEPDREILHVRKNTWGFETIAVESDAMFVRPERKLITTDEFAGSACDLNLILDTNLMHAGKNCARVTLTAGQQILQINISAKKKPKWPKDRQGHVRKIMMKQLENLYVSFRLKRIDLTAWTEHSISVLNSYKRAGGDDVYADLFLIQLYFADEKKQKALRLLEQLEDQKNRMNTPERYGFYLYITTFFYQEASYVDRIEEEVCRLFYRNQTSWQLQWILLYLQEKYLSDTNARYEAVAEQFRCGCRSRIMYLEAYQILKSNPFQMRHLGEFELSLLQFADREKAVTAEMLRQAANLASHGTNFDRRLYRVLANGYRLYPSKDLVQAICQLLLRGQKREPEYFEWYEKGVECGLRLTGLYEAYMGTMACTDLSQMPQIIRMYFAYDTSMDYRKRAAVYRGIAENRERDPQTWHSHRPAMERFVMEQLDAERITKDLAVLYRCFLRESILTKALAEKLIRLLFTYEISCDRPGIRQIVVHSVRAAGEQKVTLSDGCAQLRIYDPDSVLLAVDAQGQRFDAHSLCRIERIFEDEKMLAWCAKKAPDFAGLILFLCAEGLRSGVMNERLLPYYCSGCELRELSADFRGELRGAVLAYYLAHPREESLPEFLERISYREYVAVDKTALITLLAEEGKCHDAFSLLDTYGAEGIPLLQLVRICSRMVLELEFEEHTMLLALCHSCFVQGKYDDKLLRYLLLYYEGSVDEMKQIWRAACRFDLDTMLLEEKIIMMILFTRSGSQDSETVFDAYQKKMGRKKLCSAYVNLKAWEYFVRGLPVGDPVFRFIEKDYARLSGQNRLSDQEEVCRLALLQRYANEPSLTETQRVYAAELLEEFNAKGLRFAFWKRFDRELLRPYQMEGRVYAEYVGNPKSTVSVLYRYVGRDEEFIKEQAQNCFEGVFVREFTLFAGEKLECCFEECYEQEKIRSDIRTLTADETDSEENGMYSLLNRISRAACAGDEAEAAEALDTYLTLEYLAAEVFTLV